MLASDDTDSIHGETSPPRWHPIVEEVNPDVKVLISLSWYTTQTWSTPSVGATSPSGSGYNLWTEYWALDSTFLTQIGQASINDTLTLAPQTYGTPWPSAPFTNPTVSLWTPVSAGPTARVFAYSDANTNTYMVLSFELQSGTPWTGSIVWYAAARTGSSGPPASIVGTSSVTFTYQNGAPSLPSGYSWWYMRLPALTWPSAPTVPGQTATGVGLTSMGSSLYLADNESGTVYVRSSTGGSSWGTASSTGVTSAQRAPAIADLSGTLYVMYADTGTDRDHLKQVTSTNGTSWGSPVDSGALSSGSPALATVTSGGTSTLCLAYQTDSSSSTIHTRAWSGSAWSSTSTPATNAAGSPALAGFGAHLYMAVATSSGIDVHKAQSVSGSGITWPTSGAIATITPPSGTTWSHPSLFEWQGQLAMSLQDQNGHVWACFSSDGIQWSGYQDLTTQIPTVATNVGPAVGALGTTLVIAFNGTATGATGLATIAAT